MAAEAHMEEELQQAETVRHKRVSICLCRTLSFRGIYKVLKRIVHPKMKIYSPSGHPRFTIDEFVASSEQIWRNVSLHHLLTNGSSVVNGCRQNESPNS